MRKTMMTTCIIKIYAKKKRTKAIIKRGVNKM